MNTYIPIDSIPVRVTKGIQQFDAILISRLHLPVKDETGEIQLGPLLGFEVQDTRGFRVFAQEPQLEPR